jgi:hypothetical protein
MAAARYPTAYRLWALVAVGLFVALGFVNPAAGATWKGGSSLWLCVGILLCGEYHSSTAEALTAVVFWALILAGPAALVGWAVQALVVDARSPGRSGPAVNGGHAQRREGGI